MVSRGKDSGFDINGEEAGSDIAAYSTAGDSAGSRLKSSFDSSKLIGPDGSFLGLKVSKGMENTIRALSDQFLPHIADKLGDQANTLGRRFATNVLERDTKQAIEFGRKWGKYLGYGVVLYQPIGELAATMLNTSARLNELRLAVTPVLKANGYSPMLEGIFNDGNNEVIHNARSKIYKLAMNETVRTFARSIATAPAFYVLHQKQQAKLAAAMELEDLELLANATPEEFNRYLDKDLGMSSKVIANLDGRMREAFELRSKEYLKEFKDFKRAKGTEAKNWVLEQLEKTRERVQNQLEVKGQRSQRTGVVSELSRYDVQEYDLYKTEKDGKVVKTVKTDNELKKLIDRTTEQRLMDMFGQKSMPLDDNWVFDKPGSRGRSDKQTIQQRIVAKFDELEKKILNKSAEAKDLKNKTPKESDTLMHQGMLALGSLAGETLSGLLGTKDIKKLRQDIALDLILHMRRSLDENPQRDNIPAKEGNEEFSYALFVHKIFQQHQIDCGQPEINERYFQHLKKENWNDQDIHKMDDATLTAYEVAVKHIARNIQEGRMDALALINLVGQRKLVAKSGKSFGATGAKSDEQAARKNILKEIDKQAVLLKPHHHMEREEVSQQLGEYTFSPEELKAAFGPGGLKGDERAFMFALVDAHTPDSKVLHEITGLSEEQAKQLRSESQARFGTLLDAAIREIAEMDEGRAAALQKNNQLSAEEVKSFQQASEEAQSQHISAADTLDPKAKKAAETTVANVLMAESKQDPGFWQKRIKPRAEQIEQEAKEHTTAAQNGQEDGRTFAKMNGIGEALDSESFRHGEKHVARANNGHHLHDDEADLDIPHAARLQQAREYQAPWGLGA